jgi:hypothetical protein
LLYLASGLTSSNVILPIVSLSVAATALALLIFRCSIPLWIKAATGFESEGQADWTSSSPNCGMLMAA